MELVNKRVKKRFLGIYIVGISVLMMSTIDNFIPGAYKHFMGGDYYAPIIGVFIIFIFWLGYPLFKYDSEGGVLIIEASEPIIISKLFDKQFATEFPKVKLYNFKIKSIFFRRTLRLYIKGKKGKTTLKIPISYLSSKEIKYLNKSLNHILKNNKKDL